MQNFRSSCLTVLLIGLLFVPDVKAFWIWSPAESEPKSKIPQETKKESVTLPEKKQPEKQLSSKPEVSSETAPKVKSSKGSSIAEQEAAHKHSSWMWSPAEGKFVSSG